MKYDCWDMDCLGTNNKKCKGNVKSKHCQFKSEFEYLNNDENDYQDMIKNQ